MKILTIILEEQDPQTGATHAASRALSWIEFKSAKDQKGILLEEVQRLEEQLESYEKDKNKQTSNQNPQIEACGQSGQKEVGGDF